MEEKKKRGNPNWGKGMSSANPKGRPKGSKNTMTQLQNTLIETFAGKMTREFEDVLKSVIREAKKGDMTAAKILLDRAIPARKAVEHYGAGEQAGGVTVIITGIDGTEGRRNPAIEAEYEEVKDESEPVE